MQNVIQLIETLNKQEVSRQKVAEALEIAAHECPSLYPLLVSMMAGGYSESPDLICMDVYQAAVSYLFGSFDSGQITGTDLFMARLTTLVEGSIAVGRVSDYVVRRLNGKKLTNSQQHALHLAHSWSLFCNKALALMAGKIMSADLREEISRFIKHLPACANAVNVDFFADAEPDLRTLEGAFQSLWLTLLSWMQTTGGSFRKITLNSPGKAHWRRQRLDLPKPNTHVLTAVSSAGGLLSSVNPIAGAEGYMFSRVRSCSAVMGLGAGVTAVNWREAFRFAAIDAWSRSIPLSHLATYSGVHPSLAYGTALNASLTAAAATANLSAKELYFSDLTLLLKDAR